ncbi:MAG: hypothetical protein H6667_18315 [Ardenticatenaceae bacterium]|nr:hypothetical protein [Ardenticatenaceae bacterium]
MLNNIGSVYDSLGRWGQALEYMKAGASSWKKWATGGLATTLEQPSAVSTTAWGAGPGAEYYERRAPSVKKWATGRGLAMTLVNIGSAP